MYGGAAVWRSLLRTDAIRFTFVIRAKINRISARLHRLTQISHVYQCFNGNFSVPRQHFTLPTRSPPKSFRILGMHGKADNRTLEIFVNNSVDGRRVHLNMGPRCYAYKIMNAGSAEYPKIAIYHEIAQYMAMALVKLIALGAQNYTVRSEEFTTCIIMRSISRFNCEL